MEETRARTGAITSVMYGDDGGGGGDGLFARAFAEIRAALTDGMSAYRIDRHRRHWQRYLGGYAWENTTRGSGTRAWRPTRCAPWRPSPPVSGCGCAAPSTGI
ncbi:hypothetical protein GCM10010129_70500 [Streptomyces fumigatiscleroticus]|nr:hypothetical protein GCM10010129_70500 [Streptomyces fumigatiscleroticus]